MRNCDYAEYIFESEQLCDIKLLRWRKIKEKMQVITLEE